MMDIPPSYDLIIEEVANCGIAKSAFTIKYSESYQSELLNIRAKKNILSDKIYSCIWEIEKKYYLIVTYEDYDAHVANWSYKRPIIKKEQKALAIKRLEAKNLLDKIPQYDPEKQTLTEFINLIEKLSSVEPNTMLLVYEEDRITYKRDFLTRDNFEKKSNAIIIALDALTLSNIEDHGISFGIIGNEQIFKEEEGK